MRPRRSGSQDSRGEEVGCFVGHSPVRLGDRGLAWLVAGDAFAFGEVLAGQGWKAWSLRGEILRPMRSLTSHATRARSPSDTSLA